MFECRGRTRNKEYDEHVIAFAHDSILCDYQQIRQVQDSRGYGRHGRSCLLLGNKCQFIAAILEPSEKYYCDGPVHPKSVKNGAEFK